MSRNLTREKYEFEARHQHPGEDPIARLRHTLDLFDGTHDDEWAIIATSNAYPDGGQTGLTWGDLRAIAGMVDSPDVQSHGNARVCTNCYAALPELFDGFPSTYCQHRRPEVDQPCPAAHTEDPSPCDGPPDAVRIVDRTGAETQGCIRHAAVLLASVTGAAVYPGSAGNGSAIETHRRAQQLQPFQFEESR